MKVFKRFLAFALIAIILVFGISGVKTASADGVTRLSSVKTRVNNMDVSYARNNVYVIGWVTIDRSTVFAIKTYSESTPGTSKLISSITLPKGTSIAWHTLSNNYLYLEVYPSPNVYYLDVYSITNPKAIPVFDSSSRLPSSMYSMASDNQNHLFMASQTTVTEYLYANKKLTPLHNLGGYGSNDYIPNLYVSGNYLFEYNANTQSNQDEILKVYNKNSMQPIGSYDFSKTDYITAMASNGPHIAVGLYNPNQYKQEYTPVFQYLNITSSGKVVPATPTLNLHGGIDVSGATGVVFVNNNVYFSVANTIDKYSASGKLLGYTPMSAVYGLATDSVNHIYAISGNNSKIPQVLDTYTVTR